MQTNNMYILLMASFTLALVLLASPLVLAEDNQTTDLVVTSSSDTLLDSETIQEINDDMNESVSGLDIAKAKFGLLFTLNQEKKAEKELKLARLELIRARIFAKNNNTKAMEKSFEAHNRYLERVKERINALNGESTAKGAKNSAGKVVGLERAIEVHEARIQRLKDLIASDSNLTEEQIVLIEQRITQAENNTQHLKDVQEAKKEKLKTKLMAVNNLSEDEAENEIEELEDNKNLSEVKKLIAERRFSNLQDYLSDFKETVSEAKSSGEDVTSDEITISVLEGILQEAETFIQQGDYDKAIDKLKEFNDSKKESDKHMRENAREYKSRDSKGQKGFGKK